MVGWLQQLNRVFRGLININRGTVGGIGWHASLGVSTLVHAGALGALALCVVSYPRQAPSVALDSELKDSPSPEALRIDPPVQNAVVAIGPAGGREGESGPLAAGIETGHESAGGRNIVPLASEASVSLLDFSPGLPSKQELASSALGIKLGKGRALGGGFGSGIGAGKGDGSGAEFFDLQTAGTKFVYVLDGSGSMTQPHSEARSRLERVKIELLRSIGGLPAEMEFYVIFFNQYSIPMPAETMQPATRENKSKYLEWCMKVRGGGSTDPREAIKQALQLEPDVVYLLTDGVFTENVAGMLRKLNTGGVAVHTFCFGDASGEPQLKDIARQNNGTYKFIP